MYIDYDYDYSLYDYEENGNGKRSGREREREILDKKGAPCARNPIVSRLTCVLLRLGRIFERRGRRRGARLKESLVQARSAARQRENARRKAGGSRARKEKRGDDCAPVRGRVSAVLERNTLVYVFLVNSNSSIADFKKYLSI